jgi:hypothetical protein
MGDYDWMARENVVAASDAMRDQAAKWDDFSDAMAKTQAQFAQLTLTGAAFSVVDPAAVPAALALADSYARMHDRLNKLFGGAVEEFDRMARALRVSADKYDDSDRNAAGRMQGVW